MPSSSTTSADGALKVRDWGCGFVPAQRLYEAGEREHVGLHGISERAHLLNGVCEVRSTPGEGTALAANFPIPEAPSQLLGEGT